MAFLILGTLIPDEMREKFDVLKARREPGDLVQKYIIKSLSSVCNEEVCLISTPRIEYYPKNRVKKVDNFSFVLDDVRCNVVGFNNI